MNNTHFFQTILAQDGRIAPQTERTPEEEARNKEREAAWRAHYVQRFCPPLALLCQGTHDVNVHVVACPMCQLRLTEIEAAGVSAEDFETHTGTQEHPPLTCVQKGDICSLSSALEGWDDVYQYILAPQVLVLDVVQKSAHVAMLSSALAFQDCAQKHVPLPYGVFAETWNTLNVPVSLLARRIVTLSAEDMEQVEKAYGEAHHTHIHDIWSAEFLRGEREVAELIQARIHCLVTDKARAWDWRQACADVLKAVKDFFAVPAPVLQAASAGERVEVRIQSAAGLQLSHANILACDIKTGYVRLSMPEGIHKPIVHMIALAEHEESIINGRVDMDDAECYIQFGENALHKDSEITLLITTEA